MNVIDLSQPFAIADLLVNDIYYFVLVFTRLGTVFMLMPGISNSAVPARVRLAAALTVAAVVTPLVYQLLPPFPDDFATLMLIILIEFMTGLIFGMIARFFITAADVAGSIIGLQIGMANALLFNPVTAVQGSLTALFITLVAILVMFATGLHYLLIAAAVDSYAWLPAGVVPDTSDTAQLISQTLSNSFSVGVRMATPILVLMTVFHIAVGILTRLMPQAMIFFVALPLQIFLGWLITAVTLTAALDLWFNHAESILGTFVQSAF
ncbi:MAG: flagellar biosynthetic protein FliR [Pseudomonadota bacterium]